MVIRRQNSLPNPKLDFRSCYPRAVPCIRLPSCYSSAIVLIFGGGLRAARARSSDYSYIDEE